MSESTRKLIGTILLVALIGTYSMLVAILATTRLTAMGGVVTIAFYAAAGLLWVPPAALIIRWMLRPSRQ